MRAYLLDTNIAIALLHGNEAVGKRVADALSGDVMAICTPTVGELFFGAHAGAQVAREVTAV